MSRRRRYMVGLMALLLWSVGLPVVASAQFGCPGLRNPTTFVTGSDVFFWSGRVGERCCATMSGDTTDGYTIKSTCSDPNCPPVPASQLTSDSYDSGPDAISCGRSLNFWDNNRKRFQIITQANAGIDGFTVNSAIPGSGMPRIPPDYQTSIRLGDLYADGHTASGGCTYSASSQGENKGSEALFYTMLVTDENSLLIINYAVVTQKVDHSPYEAGEFCIRVVRKVNGVWQTEPINDSLHYKVSAPHFSGDLPAPWVEGNMSLGSCGYAYKPWTKVVVNLSAYYGDTVRIEMYTSDCIYNVDPLMAYISGDYSSMTLNIQGCSSAESDIIDSVSAIDGMISYQWFVCESGVQYSLYDPEHMDTVPFRQVFPPGSGTTTQSYYLPRIDDFVLTAGPNAGDTAVEQTVMCIMTSALDPEKPFTSRLYANLFNYKPMPHPVVTSDCNRTATFKGNIVVYGQTAIDLSETYWVLYTDTTYSQPIDTLYGQDAVYTFDSFGYYGALLHTQTVVEACESVKRVSFRVMGTPPAQMELSQHDLCDGDTLTLRCTAGMDLPKRWTVDDSVIASTEDDLANVIKMPMSVGLHRVTLETGYELSCTTTVVDSVAVYGMPTIAIGNDRSEVCPGDTVHLDAEGNVGYVWRSTPHDSTLDGQERQASIEVIPQQSTRYELMLEADIRCSVAEPGVDIEVLPYPEATIYTNRHGVSLDYPTVSFVDSSVGSVFSHWSFSDNTTADGKKVTHTFTLDNGDSVRVLLEACNRLECCDSAELALPIEVYNHWFANVFTPDEAINNRFSVISTLNFIEYEINIYNRNGLLVHTSTDPSASWDGTDLNGRPCPQGAYAYYYRYKADYDSSWHDGKGTVLLLR